MAKNLSNDNQLLHAQVNITETAALAERKAYAEQAEMNYVA